MCKTIPDVMERLLVLATAQINHSKPKKRGSRFTGSSNHADWNDVHDFLVRMSQFKSLTPLTLLYRMKKESWFPGVTYSTEWRIRNEVDKAGLRGSRPRIEHHWVRGEDGQLHPRTE